MAHTDKSYSMGHGPTKPGIAAVAGVFATAKAYPHLLRFYRKRVDAFLSVAKKLRVRPVPADKAPYQTHAGTTFLVGQKTEALQPYTIVARADDRGIPVYVIRQEGQDITSRWTRADADREFARLNS